MNTCLQVAHVLEDLYVSIWIQHAADALDQKMHSRSIDKVVKGLQLLPDNLQQQMLMQSADRLPHPKQKDDVPSIYDIFHMLPNTLQTQLKI